MDSVIGKPEEWHIAEYDSAFQREWDDFVRASRNSTFLFLRGYMDYHADRFSDCSLMAFKGDRLLAILPADLSGEGEDMTLSSHRGLTYGGWLLPARHFDCADMLRLWDVWLSWCRSRGIRRVDYKPLPGIYASMPSDEDIYALFRSGAVMSECNASAAVRLAANPGLNSLQRRHLRKSASSGVCIERTVTGEGLAAFHAMLSDCLAERHDAAPVHSLDELRMLAERFPDNIEIWMAYVDGEPHAGVCMYQTARTGHAQYIATTPAGRRLNLLTPLFVSLMERSASLGQEFFDFGISNEDHGRWLNEGLYRHKASLGASAVAYTRWTIPL